MLYIKATPVFAAGTSVEDVTMELKFNTFVEDKLLFSTTFEDFHKDCVSFAETFPYMRGNSIWSIRQSLQVIIDKLKTDNPIDQALLDKALLYHKEYDNQHYVKAILWSTILILPFLLAAIVSPDLK